MNIFDRQSEFWKKFQAGRADIPASFYQRFYDYHAGKGGLFDTVYDVGAAFGGNSLELSKKFSHVIVGDPALKSLDVTRQFIETTTKTNGDNASKFTFRQERIEDSDLPEASVDAFFLYNTIHWTDLDKAMAVMARQLKPGGTLFVCLSGIPKYDPKIQPGWWKMMDAFLSEVAARRSKAGSERDLATQDKSDVEHILAIQDNGYDGVPIPETYFEPGAIRLKLNTLDDPHAFVMAPENSKNATLVSKIGPNDVVEKGEDKDWFFEADIDTIRATANAYPLDPDPKVMDQHLAELEKILGGGKCEGHWPVSIIMATKRKQN